MEIVRETRFLGPFHNPRILHIRQFLGYRRIHFSNITMTGSGEAASPSPDPDWSATLRPVRAEPLRTIRVWGGQFVTVTAFASVEVPKLLRFVTVIERAVLAAPEVTLSTTVIRVALWTRGLLTVTPEPETVTVVWLLKPVPVSVTVVSRPARTVAGETDVIVGLATIVRQLVQVAEVPLVLVTVTLRAPTGAPPATLTRRVTRVLVRPVTVAVTPVPLTAAVIPALKPLPFTWTVTASAPWPSWAGLTPVIRGAVAIVTVTGELVPTLLAASDCEATSV